MQHTPVQSRSQYMDHTGRGCQEETRQSLQKPCTYTLPHNTLSFVYKFEFYHLVCSLYLSFGCLNYIGGFFREKKGSFFFSFLCKKVENPKNSKTPKKSQTQYKTLPFVIYSHHRHSICTFAKTYREFCLQPDSAD